MYSDTLLAIWKIVTVQHHKQAGTQAVRHGIGSIGAVHKPPLAKHGVLSSIWVCVVFCRVTRINAKARIDG